MRRLICLCSPATLLALATGCSSLNDPAASIPSHPDQLTYPRLSYEPPDPKDHRVRLKSGPVAYLVPDRELPLVDIVVFIDSDILDDIFSPESSVAAAPLDMLQEGPPPASATSN